MPSIPAKKADMMPAGALDITTLASLQHHPRIAPLVAKHQMLKTQATALAAELQQAEEAVADAEKQAGAWLAASDVEQTWELGPELAAAKQQHENLGSRSCIVAHALTTLAEDLATLIAEVRGEVASVLRGQVVKELATLIEHLEQTQKQYDTLEQLLQHGLRLLGQDARYIVSPELFDTRLEHHLDTVRAQHAQQSAQLRLRP